VQCVGFFIFMKLPTIEEMKRRNSGLERSAGSSKKVSFRKLTKAFWFEQAAGLNTAERCVLISLSLHCGRDNKCTVSERTLAKGIQIGLNTVLRAIKSLEERELILIERRFKQTSTYLVEPFE